MFSRNKINIVLCFKFITILSFGANAEVLKLECAVRYPVGDRVERYVINTNLGTIERNGFQFRTEDVVISNNQFSYVVHMPVGEGAIRCGIKDWWTTIDRETGELVSSSEFCSPESKSKTFGDCKYLGKMPKKNHSANNAREADDAAKSAKIKF